ncbi:hypothetical protein ACFY12_15205 [Streptomyces sp. NPDC001339]|uniref:hypothetical protein n=1 Tax=Streptomyces sp. NPDC001339 TaxID=3364563 RepID=UPI0036BAF071
MQHRWKLTGGLAASLGLALTGVMCSAGPASADTATKTLDYICRTRVDGNWIPVPYSRDFTTTAPAKVTPGQTFKVTFDSAPINAVADFNKLLNNVSFAYRTPANAEVVGYRLVGGSNLGSARQWVERDGDTFKVKSDGEWAGGVEFDFPNLEVTLKAPSTNGATLTTGAGGTSFEDTSFGWTRLQTQLNTWDPFQCYADPAKPVAFSTTQVGS